MVERESRETRMARGPAAAVQGLNLKAAARPGAPTERRRKTRATERSERERGREKRKEKREKWREGE